MHKLLTCLLACIFLSACEPAVKDHNYTIFTFGTLVDVTLFGIDKTLADDAFEQLQQDFDDYHQQWSPWTHGDLAKINEQIAVGESNIVIANHLLPIIKTSIALSERSDNLFNPAIGQLINLWQFHKHQQADIKPPDAELIQALLNKNPQMSDLSFTQDNLMLSKNPAVALNFGAFAKGYAIALAMQTLKKMGINHAVINAGGDLSVAGRHSDGDRDWNVGIRDPRSAKILASISTKGNESIFSSGDYERTYIYQGQRYHHILNPATGYPTTDAQSVTVIHSDAGLADAAATAIFVAGSKHWLKIAKKMGIRYLMLVDANGDIHLTTAMNKRIKFLNKSPTSHIFVSEAL